MKLLIRVDMNNFIATGHVMRCLSIADAAIKQGVQVLFVSADECGRSVIEERGFNFISLGTEWNKMNEEIEKLSNIISFTCPDYILVDSYYVTSEYLGKLKNMCKVAYIDDLCNDIYPCDTLICYANYYRKYTYEKKYAVNTKLLLGSKYTPLREAFNIQTTKSISLIVKELLILSGGTDPFHFLKTFMKSVEERKGVWENVNLVVVCGVYNADYEEMVEYYGCNQNIEILRGIHNIEKYMQSADMAISAGGTSLYELCACGTPTICYTFADNQLDNAKSFHKDGVMIYAGDLKSAEAVENIILQTEVLMQDYNKRRSMSTKMKQLVDGKGAERIVRGLE